ncbi:hypothetical protein P2318_12785 [Myxococcaceae bacterium GXIMD 01537]
MLRTVTAATAALALLASCAPDTQPPVKVRALVLTSTGEYVPQEVQLNTVTDIVSLEGSVARFVGGAAITVDSEDPALQNVTTDEQLTNALLKNKGRAVTANYIEKDGVLWPADFHTWNLVTAYHALERANDYFRTVGGLVDADFGGSTTVYYFPDFILKDSSKDPLRDNALYFPPVNAFMVLPFEEIQTAPLSINAAVLAHEYAHRVFNQKVYGGESLPTPIALWGGSGPTPGANILKSLDEGLADYHAYGTSCVGPSGCNTRVLSTSFTDAQAADRDIATPRCLRNQLRDLMYGGNLSTQFSGYEYTVGTVLANALYKAGLVNNQHRVIQRAVLAAYSDSNPDTPGLAQLTQATLSDQTQFTLELALGAIAIHIQDASLRQLVCNEFVDRLNASRDELVRLDACPQGTISQRTTCRGT